MNRDMSRILGPLLALALFAFVLVQTLQALQVSGVWRFDAPTASVPAADPLASLDDLIARAQGSAFEGASRDPFGYVAAAPGPRDDRPVVRRPIVPPRPAEPVLTAIIYDYDPRAIVRWKDREYIVRAGSLFAEFEVLSITREQVVVKHGSETLVLRRKPQGD